MSLPQQRFVPPDRARVEERLRRFFAADPRGAVAVYLFGSVARDNARPGSDVDVAVLFEKAPPRTLAGLHLGLAGDLEALLEAPVQLIVLNRASADLVHNILLDGRLLLDRDPGRRIEFEVRLRNEYFDLQPFLERYRRCGSSP